MVGSSKRRLQDSKIEGLSEDSRFTLAYGAAHALALAAASAIGDDTLQKQSQGYVSPDSFTHGSSEQRVKWFRVGLASGDMNNCNTFKSLSGL